MSYLQSVDDYLGDYYSLLSSDSDISDNDSYYSDSSDIDSSDSDFIFY